VVPDWRKRKQTLVMKDSPSKVQSQSPKQPVPEVPKTSLIRIKNSWVRIKKPATLSTNQLEPGRFSKVGFKPELRVYGI